MTKKGYFQSRFKYFRYMGKSHKAFMSQTKGSVIQIPKKSKKGTNTKTARDFTINSMQEENTGVFL